MNNTDIIKLAPEQNAKDELKKIVTYAYTALGQKPADQTIEMSADFIYDKVSRDTTLQQVKDVIRQVGLDPDSKQPAGKFSLGMRHRLGIAQAIMENPPLLILDEPMNGLDKNGVLEMRTLLRKLCDENGTTIIMSSHYAEDIEALCDTVCEMDGGVLTKIRGHAE